MPASPLTESQLNDALRLNVLFKTWQKNERALGNKDVSQESVSDKLGFGQSALSQYLRGRIPLNADVATKLAELLGCTVYDFSPSIASEIIGLAEKYGAVSLKKKFDADELEDAPAAIGRMKKIPIVGRVQAGPDGTIEIDDYPAGQGDGYMLWWSTCDHAYVLRIRGDSMSPRYRPGEFVGVDPCARTEPSDEVIVLLKDGKRMIKNLLWIKDEQACFASINEDFKNITCDLEDVEALHLVLGRIPKQAFRAD